MAPPAANGAVIDRRSSGGAVSRARSLTPLRSVRRPTRPRSAAQNRQPPDSRAKCASNLVSLFAHGSAGREFIVDIGEDRERGECSCSVGMGPDEFGVVSGRQRDALASTKKSSTATDHGSGRPARLRATSESARAERQENRSKRRQSLYRGDDRPAVRRGLAGRAPLGLRRPLGRPAPRVVGRCRARGRAAAGVSGVWRNRLAYRSGVRLRPLGRPATRVVRRCSACGRAATASGRKNLCGEPACQYNCASVLCDCHGSLQKRSRPAAKRTRRSTPWFPG